MSDSYIVIDITAMEQMISATKERGDSPGDIFISLLATLLAELPPDGTEFGHGEITAFAVQCVQIVALLYRYDGDRLAGYLSAVQIQPPPGLVTPFINFMDAFAKVVEKVG